MHGLPGGSWSSKRSSERINHSWEYVKSEQRKQLGADQTFTVFPIYKGTLIFDTHMPSLICTNRFNQFSGVNVKCGQNLLSLLLSLSQNTLVKNIKGIVWCMCSISWENCLANKKPCNVFEVVIWARIIKSESLANIWHRSKSRGIDRLSAIFIRFFVIYRTCSGFRVKH